MFIVSICQCGQVAHLFFFFEAQANEKNKKVMETKKINLLFTAIRFFTLFTVNLRKI
jgi:hypothetical protein